MKETAVWIGAADPGSVGKALQTKFHPEEAGRVFPELQMAGSRDGASNMLYLGNSILLKF